MAALNGNMFSILSKKKNFIASSKKPNHYHNNDNSEFEYSSEDIEIEDEEEALNSIYVTSNHGNGNGDENKFQYDYASEVDYDSDTADEAPYNPMEDLDALGDLLEVSGIPEPVPAPVPRIPEDDDFETAAAVPNNYLKPKSLKEDNFKLNNRERNLSRKPTTYPNTTMLASKDRTLPKMSNMSELETVPALAKSQSTVPTVSAAKKKKKKKNKKKSKSKNNDESVISDQAPHLTRQLRKQSSFDDSDNSQLFSEIHPLLDVFSSAVAFTLMGDLIVDPNRFNKDLKLYKLTQPTPKPKSNGPRRPNEGLDWLSRMVKNYRCSMKEPYTYITTNLKAMLESDSISKRRLCLFVKRSLKLLGSDNYSTVAEKLREFQKYRQTKPKSLLYTFTNNIHTNPQEEYFYKQALLVNLLNYMDQFTKVCMNYFDKLGAVVELIIEKYERKPDILQMEEERLQINDMVEYYFGNGSRFVTEGFKGYARDVHIVGTIIFSNYGQLTEELPKLLHRILFYCQDDWQYFY